MTEPLKMDLREFISEGFLQEANRQFFHLHGLSLGVEFRGNKPLKLLVYDAREDKEGFVYEPEQINNISVAKVYVERTKHALHRISLFGQEMQPPNYEQDIDVPPAREAVPAPSEPPPLFKKS